MFSSGWEFSNNSQQKSLKGEFDGKQTIAICYGSSKSLGDILQINRQISLCYYLSVIRNALCQCF